MAIVTWPLSSAEARGRVGGLIYNTWRGRSYVKSYALHQSEFTPAQINVRATAAIVTAAWQALDIPHRSQWETFSRIHLMPSWTGTPKRISAYNWFMILIWNAAAYSGGPFYAPPTALPNYLIEMPSAEYVAPNIIITWTVQPNDPINSWLVQLFVEGPYPHRRTPSVKRAHFYDITIQDNGIMPFVPPASGWYGLHINAVPTCGIKLPQTNFMIEVP